MFNLEVYPIKYSTCVWDDSKTIWRLLNDAPQHNKYYYETTSQLKTGYRIVGKWTMHVTRIKLKPGEPSAADSDLLLDALPKELTVFYRYLKTKATAVMQPDVFHKEFWDSVGKYHEEQAKNKQLLVKIAIQNELEYYCKNYQVAVRESKYGAELLNEFIRHFNTLNEIIDYKENKKWVKILKNNKIITHKIRLDLHKIKYKIYKRSIFNLSERAKFLKKHVDSEWFQLICKIESLSAGYKAKFNLIDDLRQMVNGVISNISNLIYDNDMLEPFCCSTNSYQAIENIKYNWDLFESKFETNELVMQIN